MFAEQIKKLLKRDDLVLASERAKKYNTEYDRVYATHLVKKVCGLDPDIGAFYFPNTKMIVFHVKNLIIHKVMMDEHNLSDPKSIDRHVEHVKKVLKMLELGLISVAQIKPAFINWEQGKIVH
jgi:hypothetical protein